MKKTITLTLALVVAISFLAAAQALSVGKYCLAFWRETGYYEKGGTGGMHVLNVHVWDENGNPMVNKEIITEGGLSLGFTDSKGQLEIALFEPNSYPVRVNDGANLSDTTPGFSTTRAPDWGHYCFECGFLYKSDSGNSGTFDLAYDGVFNSTSDQPCNLSAPRTRSLAFYSTKPDVGYYCSDNRGPGNAATSIGQLFKATGDRVVACKAHVMGSFPMQYVARIRQGGPTGAYVGTAAISPDTGEYEYQKTLTKWPKDGVPVTPGATYYLEITRNGGGNIQGYRVVNNNYPDGCYYEGTTAYSGYELEGHVVCCSVSGGPTTGTISGNVKDNNNNNLAGVTVSTNTGGYSATTDANGNYTISGVAAGTYDVTASKTGYNSQTQTGKTVTAGQTTTVNFTLTQQQQQFSGIQNKNFEGGFYNDPDVDHQSGNYWHRFSISGSSKAGGVYGTYHSANWSQSIYESNWVAGIYQQATGATVGNNYTASVWVRGSDTSVKFWVGIDPTGGTDAASANVQWSAECIPGTTWTQISKQVAASSGTITMFVKAQNIATINKYAYIDDADLVDNGGGPSTGTLTGNVKDQAGANVSGATVTTNTGGYSATTDANGNYTISNVAAGTYDVTASKSGYNSQTQSGKTVTAGQTTTVNFTITRQTGTLTGNVKDQAGANLSGAIVTTNTGGYSATTDANGNYTITNVATGTYDVTASKAGYNSQTQTGKTVNYNQTTTVNFTLTSVSNGTISGNVKNKDGVNIAGATVSTNTGGYSATTDANGNYTISNVAAGTYNVTASKSGYVSEVKNGISVTAGQTTTCNFTNLYIAAQNFDSVPSWTTSYNASWGSSATFSSVAGGQSGNFLQVSRTSQGSSARVIVYNVPANTNITISVYMKCPSYANSYWIESAYRLGNYSAQDFDQNPGNWTLIKKFSNSGGYDNGNGDTWVKYTKTLNTGSYTQISIGYKHGASGCTGPTVGWDTFLMD